MQKKKEYYNLLNRFSKNKISKLPSVKKINGFVFIFMDGTNEMVSMPRGYYKEKELIIFYYFNDLIYCSKSLSGIVLLKFSI